MIEVRIRLKSTLARTIRAAEERIRDACDTFRRQGVDRRLVRVHGARTEREPGGRVALVWRVAQEEMWIGDVWTRQPTGRLDG